MYNIIYLGVAMVSATVFITKWGGEEMLKNRVIYPLKKFYFTCLKGPGVDLKVPSQSQTEWLRRISAPKPLRQITIDWILSSSVQSLKSIKSTPSPVWENLSGTAVKIDMNSAICMQSHGILGGGSNVCLFLQRAILMAPVLEALQVVLGMLCGACWC